jgi:mRNA interferase MazF
MKVAVVRHGFGAPDCQKDSVANVSQIVTLDKEFLTELAGRIEGRILSDIDSGLRLVLSS